MSSSPSWARASLLALAVAVGATMATGAGADQRYFTYSYEPKVLPAGAIELEQWATMRNGRGHIQFFK